MSARSVVTASLVSLAVVPALRAQQPNPAIKDQDALIQVAMSAGPKEIADKAAIMLPGADGKMTQLRAGTNGWTCIPDAPDTPGKDPMCADQQAMIWVGSWLKHDPKPANTGPGLVYMLVGGSDISATDPWAKPEKGAKWISSPPHYMIMWPFQPGTSGLPSTPKTTGTWIMWSGTPYAHLMINQKP